MKDFGISRPIAPRAIFTANTPESEGEQNYLEAEPPALNFDHFLSSAEGFHFSFGTYL